MSLEDRLQALARKYAELHRLRLRREELEGQGHAGFDEAEGLERRDTFRKLAEEFPGALRELEVSPAALLAEKLAAVEEEIARARLDPALEQPARRWVAVVLDFHAELRLLLRQKRHGGLERPPDGRLLSLVYAALETRHQLPRARLETAVFGPGIEG